jgi:hypothetical protein
MSKSNALETALLGLLFKNQAIAGIGDASGLQPSAVAGSLYVSLHTADPGEAGDQTTNEATYTSYARVGVVRSAAGWTVTGNLVENAGAVTFPQCTGGSETITHFGIGEDPTGAGDLLYSGALTASLAVSNGITPEFAVGDVDVTED